MYNCIQFEEHTIYHLLDIETKIHMFTDRRTIRHIETINTSSRDTYTIQTGCSFNCICFSFKLPLPTCLLLLCWQMVVLLGILPNGFRWI